MIKRDGHNNSLWQTTVNEYRSANKIDSGKLYDVVIVGGGITGITTALLLQHAGMNCLVLEAHNLCFGTTGGTTAHINTLLDVPYSTIEKNFSKEKSRLMASSLKEAVNLIRDNIEKYNIDCEFVNTTATLFAQTDEQVKELEKISQATTDAGIENKFVNEISIPVSFVRAIEVDGQAKFNPVRYVYRLAEEFEKFGGTIVQQCRVLKTEETEDVAVETSRGKCKGRFLIYATHIPPGVNLLHFRCMPYRSYAMAITLKNKKYPGDLLYDMYDPYHYYRTQEINGKKYWDGGILSNTPVRELVHKYDDFWVKILGLDSDNSSANSESNNKLFDNDIVELNKIIKQKKIPNLELSIVNLHPSEERNEQIPSLYDYDMTKDRENDIRFHDKTENDIRMTQFVSDYHELAINLFNLVIDSMKKMKETGNKNDDINNLKKELKAILNQVQRTSSHEGKPRYYYDLLTKKFDVEEVIKVQRKDDKHTISDKIFDFSSITISNLIREGEKDTVNELMQHEIENKGNKTALNEFEKFITDIKDEKIESEENQYIIQLAEEKLNELRQSKSK